MGKRLQKSQPPGSPFVPQCECSDPECTINVNGPKVAEYMGHTLNFTMAALCALKEMASGTGLDVPGLRASAGGALWILEHVASMGDNKRAFAFLLHDCMNMTTIVAKFAIKVQQNDRSLPKDFLDQLEVFCKTMNVIKEVVRGMLDRGRFARFAMAKADKVKIEEHRTRLTQAMVSFQVFMTMHIYAKTNTDGQKPPPDRKMDVSKIPEVAKQLIQTKLDVMEKEYNIIHQTTSITGPINNAAAPISVISSPGAQVVNSGNVKNEVLQNAHNNYGSNTYYNTYAVPSPPPSTGPYSYPYNAYGAGTPGHSQWG
ncbi:hypothetical protein FA15DRAFT_758595 [Coprinopsis marcescibilis]|uniref:Uncharacterized protein n=1 Tax=Coprinopsis marcescibilis TaxID=230819 RepID=A0A5C3KMP9_COPMA|nr:hypothetical protein FA15DRAFT_758595 [Coprinopsis marcescibilis]